VDEYKPSGLSEGYRKAGPYMGLGIQFAASVIGCFLLGRWIDGKIETEPIGALIGFLLGTTAGMVSLIRSVNHLHDLEAGSKKKSNGSEVE
jgi:ATP synthase protein I